LSHTYGSIDHISVTGRQVLLNAMLPPENDELLKTKMANISRLRPKLSDSAWRVTAMAVRHGKGYGMERVKGSDCQLKSVIIII
jgi:hypothetical protein